MELVLPMYNVHPYFSLKNLGPELCITYGKIWYVCSWFNRVLIPPISCTWKRNHLGDASLP